MRAPARPATTPDRAPHRGVALRSTLWFAPVLMIAGGLLLGYLVNRLDDRYATDELPTWLHRGSAEDIRIVLATVASSLIGVLALVLTITIVALQLASTTLGPRLLRVFVRDPITQVTIGLFTATFAYALVVLGDLEGNGDPPHAGASLALALAVACIVLLVVFIHHIATSIQVNAVVAHINGDLHRAIAERRDEVERARAGHDPAVLAVAAAELGPRIDAEGIDVLSRTSGFLQTVDRPSLVATSAARGAVVRLRYRPGQFVMTGTALATVWPGEHASALADPVEDAMVVGDHRSLRQDLGLAVDQLVEIALRALSPAVNDTFTGLTCVDWLGEALRALAPIPVDWTANADAGGAVRVIEEPLTYSRLVLAAFDRIRHAGGSDPAVAERLLRTIERLAPFLTTDEQRQALARQADLVVAGARGGAWAAADAADLAERAAVARRSLERDG
ncbi:MAG: DUF2254 domain-containing protein [Acidimicrobiales bacterium]|nr:DUF2254 domain-containing protein [Acidimicrobiales bacterium]